MWVRPEFPDTSTSDDSRNLLSKGGNILGHPDDKGNRMAHTYGFSLSLKPKGNSKVELDMSTANGGVYTSPIVLRRESGWTHLAIVSRRDGGGASRGIYYIQTGEVPYEPAPKSNVIVGRDSLTPTGNPFKGQIAGLRIWNRALDAAEVERYKTAALTGNEPNLVGCWTFEQGQGQRVRDLSRFKNDASLGSSYAPEDSDPAWVRIGAEEESTKPLNARFDVQQPAATKESASLANIFIMEPSQSTCGIFDKIVSVTQDWTWNKTGRQHSKESYDEIFDGTHNRSPNDVLVMVVSLDREDRIPTEYEDLLPKPWPQIEAELKQGRTMNLLGKARGLNTILIAVPDMERLEKAIASSKFLNNPKSFLKTSGKGCDVAVEEFKITSDPDRLLHYALVSIRNSGKVASPACLVSFRRGAADQEKPMIHGAGPIEPGKVWNESSSPFGLREGVNQISVVLDPANLIEELNENNNRASLKVVVENGRIIQQTPEP